MKYFAILFIALVARTAASAVPAQPMDQREGQRWISGIVASAVEDLSTTIQERGYDPFHIEATTVNYGLPVPDLFSASAYLEELLVVGASDLVINQVSYSVLSSRATFDISLPSFEISIRKAGFRSVIMNREISGDADGRIAVRDVGIRGEARISIGIISGVNIQSIDLNFYLGVIESRISNLVVLGTNYAELFNDVLNVLVYEAVLDSYGSIKEMLEIIAWQVIEELL